MKMLSSSVHEPILEEDEQHEIQRINEQVQNQENRVPSLHKNISAPPPHHHVIQAQEEDNQDEKDDQINKLTDLVNVLMHEQKSLKTKLEMQEKSF